MVLSIVKALMGNIHLCRASPSDLLVSAIRSKLVRFTESLFLARLTAVVEIGDPRRAYGGHKSSLLRALNAIAVRKYMIVRADFSEKSDEGWSK